MYTRRLINRKLNLLRPCVRTAQRIYIMCSVCTSTGGEDNEKGVALARPLHNILYV